MTSDEENLFIEYWEKRRDREGSFVYQLLSGLPLGFLFALPIMIILITSKYWFKRADMVANSQMSAGVIGTAIFFIAAFVAVLYRRHQWEMKDQQYKEFKAKKAHQSDRGQATI